MSKQNHASFCAPSLTTNSNNVVFSNALHFSKVFWTVIWSSQLLWKWSGWNLLFILYIRGERLAFFFFFWSCITGDLSWTRGSWLLGITATFTNGYTCTPSFSFPISLLVPNTRPQRTSRSSLRLLWHVWALELIWTATVTLLPYASFGDLAPCVPSVVWHDCDTCGMTFVYCNGKTIV